MTEDELFKNLINNLHIRYEYYKYKIYEATKGLDKSRYNKLNYEAKKEVVKSILNELGMSNGIIVEYYPKALEMLKDKYGDVINE